MTRPATLRPRARRDLRAIWRYTADRWDAGQADAYLKQVIADIRKLSGADRRTRSADTLYPGLCRIRSGSHVIFFLIDPDRIDVVRILHERMDFAARLGGELTPQA